MLNDFSYALGLSTAYAWSDIFGFDDELLAMVPPNCRAVVLLFPITDKSERFQKEEREDIENGKRANEVSSNVYYMKQTVGNACGTIGVFHAIMNNREDVLTNQNEEDEEENKKLLSKIFRKDEGHDPGRTREIRGIRHGFRVVSRDSGERGRYGSAFSGCED